MADIEQGVSKTETCEKLAREYKLGYKQIERQYVDVCKTLDESLSKQRAEIAVSVWKRKEVLYKKCVNERKYKTALDVLIAIGRMASLYDGKLAEEKQPEVIRVSEKNFALKAVGDDSGDKES